MKCIHLKTNTTGTNREQNVYSAKYNESHIKRLKGEASRKWWSEVKQLSGMKSADVNLSDQIRSDQC